MLYSLHNVHFKATADHELSPSNKSQKRGLESTFTPKMRTRTFSVKRQVVKQHVIRLHVLVPGAASWALFKFAFIKKKHLSLLKTFALQVQEKEV